MNREGDSRTAGQGDKYVLIVHYFTIAFGARILNENRNSLAAFEVLNSRGAKHSQFPSTV